MRYRAFICPRCGAISTYQDPKLKEKWKEHVYYVLNPEDVSEYKKYEGDSADFICIECEECNSSMNILPCHMNGESYPLEALLASIDEQENKITIAFEGSHFLEMEEQEIEEVLKRIADYTGKEVNMVDIEKFFDQ